MMCWGKNTAPVLPSEQGGWFCCRNIRAALPTVLWPLLSLPRLQTSCRWLHQSASDVRLQWSHGFMGYRSGIVDPLCSTSCRLCDISVASWLLWRVKFMVGHSVARQSYGASELWYVRVWRVKVMVGRSCCASECCVSVVARFTLAPQS